MSTAYRTKQNQFLPIILLASALGLGQTFIPYAAQQANASVAFKPSKVGAPGKTRGGASRGDVVCSRLPADATKRFMLLTPTDSNAGLTISGHPTFFAYVPPTDASGMFISLKDEYGNVHYQAIIPTLGKGGIVGISLPESAPPLEVGRYYQWGIAILCSGKLRPDSPFVSSWIKRVEPTAVLAKQLKASTMLEQATAYAAEGIWYDTLSTLAKLRQQQSNTPAIIAEWKGLLTAVGLSTVAAEPLEDQH